jgi:FKBP-type peptidyl-prolyl cis-trans isomerase
MNVYKYLIFVFPVIFYQCTHSTIPENNNHYKGVRWQIFAFEDTIKKFQFNDFLHLDAEFLTSADSVFWNSHHEGNDKFFIQLLDTTQHPFFYPFYLSSEKDSLLIIADKKTVLSDVFNIQICPDFLKNDSVIKCFVKIKKHLKSLENAYFEDFEKDEEKMIADFLEKTKTLHQKDENGIVWLEPLPIPEFKNRKNVKEATVAYSGYFLDGRMIDHCDSLGIHYNDTLQLIEGLNYVIKKLNIGQSAKIIIPSPLAFGKRGSFNKTIPPFTPILYEIKLTQIK